MKILTPIIILILVVLGIYFFNSKKSTNAPTVVLPDISGEELANDFEGNFIFDPAQSSAKWTGSKKIIVDYFDSGSINIKSGNINFSNGSIAGGEIVFDMQSIFAVTTGRGDGQDNLTRHLKSEDFFEVETYPEARYVVNSSTQTSEGYVLNGDLTLKGKTNPISVNVKTATESGNVILVGLAEVNRADFDVRFGSESFFNNLGDNVINDIFTLEFSIVARP